MALNMIVLIMNFKALALTISNTHFQGFVLIELSDPKVGGLSAPCTPVTPTNEIVCHTCYPPVSE